MARKPTQPTIEATHQSIAADLAEFRRRGGRIEVLGNTPLRQFQASSPFRSSAEQRKPPPPVKKRASR